MSFSLKKKYAQICNVKLVPFFTDVNSITPWTIGLQIDESSPLFLTSSSVFQNFSLLLLMLKFRLLIALRNVPKLVPTSFDIKIHTSDSFRRNVTLNF